MKEIKKIRVRTFAMWAIPLILVVLIALIIGFFSIERNSKEDELTEKNQEFQRRLNEEEAAHNLTKTQHAILEKKFTQFLFSSPEEIEFKTYLIRLLEEKFRVRLSDEDIPWDTHEAYAVLQIFQVFPNDLQEYFLQEANPVLTIKIESPDRMTTDGKIAYGLYYPCLHSISLNQNMMRGSSFSFPVESEIRVFITHEIGHAYDRSRALAELNQAFDCKIPNRTFYSLGNDQYRKLIEGGASTFSEENTYDIPEALIIENFATVFEQFITHRGKQFQKKIAPRQYDFFYSNVFCAKYLSVLKELEEQNAEFLSGNPSLLYELKDQALDLSKSRYLCS